MGCTQSAPIEKAPPQPIPTLKELESHKFETFKNEPLLPHSEEYMSDELVRIQVKKSHKAGVGDSYKALSIQTDENGEDVAYGAWRDLNVEPALLVPGVRRNMQDLSCVKDYANDKRLIAFYVRDVSRGPDHFQILTPKQVRPDQKAAEWKGPSKQTLYPLARIAFDTKTTVCHVHLTGQSDQSDAIFTMRAGSKTTWIVL